MKKFILNQIINIQSSSNTRSHSTVNLIGGSQNAPTMLGQNRTEHNRTEQNRTEQNRTEQNRTEQNRTEQNRTHKLRWGQAEFNNFVGIRSCKTI